MISNHTRRAALCKVKMQRSRRVEEWRLKSWRIGAVEECDFGTVGEWARQHSGRARFSAAYSAHDVMGFSP